MNSHGSAFGRVKSLREPDVIDVGVGENDCFDVAEFPACSGEEPEEMAPVPGESRIDERQPAALLDGVEVDERRSQTVDSGCDLHRPSRPRPDRMTVHPARRGVHSPRRSHGP